MLRAAFRILHRDVIAIRQTTQAEARGYLVEELILIA